MMHARYPIMSIIQPMTIHQDEAIGAYAMHEHYQKRMDVIADRFYKATGVATVVCFSFTCTI
jgi:hypothetical protein